MLRTLIKRLLGRPPNPEPTGLIVAPTNIPANIPVYDPAPPRVQLVTQRHVLRRNRTNTLVLSGTSVTSRNGITMKVASGEQKPPYVRCTYRGRPIAVRPDTIDCHWDTVSEPIQ